MMENCMVSVIIPVYNVGDRLERCIESVVGQSYADLQIILVDDGSTDGSAAVCDKWESLDSRVVVHKKNAGVSKARNMGLALAKGKYVAFVDADDYLCPEMYSTLVDEAVHTGADQVCCCIKNVYATTTKEEKHAFGRNVLWNRKAIYEEIILSLLNPEESDGKANLLQSPCNKLYSRHIIEQNSIEFDTELTYAEDWLFIVNFYRHTECIAFVPEYLYYYDRTTEGSLSKKFRWNGFDQSVKIRNYEKEWFPEYCTDDAYNSLILKIETHYLRQYVERNGLVGFSKYARHLFQNQTLKKFYISAQNIKGTSKIPKKCFENDDRYIYIYILWAASQTVACAAKHYIKKAIRRI